MAVPTFPATGWAVINNIGSILVNTVSFTRRAAIVNWLVTEARVLVLAHWDDEYIERIWHEKTEGTDIICTTVTITRTG